jgi:hypothetical protein
MKSLADLTEEEADVLLDLLNRNRGVLYTAVHENHNPSMRIRERRFDVLMEFADIGSECYPDLDEAEPEEVENELKKLIPNTALVECIMHEYKCLRQIQESRLKYFKVMDKVLSIHEDRREQKRKAENE